MSRVYIPTSGAHEWQWLLARPGLQWKHGASAMALADAWEHADGLPASVAAALATVISSRNLELLLALPEHEVPLPGGRAASQTDLFVLARRSGEDLVAIAVEGKADEPFGDSTVAEWRGADGSGRETPLAYLLDVLELPDDDRLAPIRYQLLHRTASAVIEAARFGAEHAVMLVHSFSPTAARFDDFEAFAALYDADAEKGRTVPCAHAGRCLAASGLGQR